VQTHPAPVRIVVLDANVLFPLSLRDLLLRAFEKGLYRLQISRQIWDEVIRNLVENGRMTQEQAAYLDTRVLAFLAETDALVDGYQALIPTLTNDPKDRHVLAAAIHSHAATIVTFNLKDFPPQALASSGVSAEHPDVFACGLYAENATAMAAVVREQAAGLRRPPLTISEVLDTLERHVPELVALLRPALQDHSPA
jgi:predicted nucleic acid-binding protein